MKQLKSFLTLFLLSALTLPAAAVGVVDHEPLALQEKTRESFLPGIYISDWSDILVTIDIMLVIIGVIWLANYLFQRLVFRRRSGQSYKNSF